MRLVLALLRLLFLLFFWPSLAQADSLCEQTWIDLRHASWPLVLDGLWDHLHEEPERLVFPWQPLSDRKIFAGYPVAPDTYEPGKSPSSILRLRMFGLKPRPDGYHLETRREDAPHSWAIIKEQNFRTVLKWTVGEQQSLSFYPEAEGEIWTIFLHWTEHENPWHKPWSPIRLLAGQPQERSGRALQVSLWSRIWKAIMRPKQKGYQRCPRGERKASQLSHSSNELWSFDP